MCVTVVSCWLFSIVCQGWPTDKVTFEQGVKAMRALVMRMAWVKAFAL